MRHLNKINFTYFLALAIAFFTFQNANAQEYRTTDGSIWYEGNLKPCINVVVDYDEPKVLIDKWETFLQSKKGVDLDKQYSRLGKTMMASDWVSFREITPEPMQFHTQFVRHANNTEMNIFVNFGNGYFMNPYVHEKEYESTKLLVAEFMNEFRGGEISANRYK